MLPPIHELPQFTRVYYNGLPNHHNTGILVHTTKRTYIVTPYTLLIYNPITHIFQSAVNVSPFQLVTANNFTLYALAYD